MEFTMETFVGKIETFIQGLLKIINGFLALLGMDSLSLGSLFNK